MYLNITRAMLASGYVQDFWTLAAMRYDPKVLERKEGIYLTEANLQEFCDLVEPKKDFITYLFQIAADGGQFGQVDLYIKLGNHLLSQEVPQGLQDRTYTNEEGAQSVHTWQSWGVAQNYDPFIPCKEQGFTTRCINPIGRFCSMEEVLAIRHYCEYQISAELLSPKKMQENTPM